LIFWAVEDLCREKFRDWQGPIDLSLPPLLEANTVPALRVEAEKAPLHVARHLFRMTKLHSSRLCGAFSVTTEAAMKDQ
tara:strand:- start:1365 stop:1601 length:237 start_codon:yes stop_codon:yes gene_type:complete